MTNEEILKRVIERAINNGWLNLTNKAHLLAAIQINEMINCYKDKIEIIIFDRSFLKAFFGKGKEVCGSCLSGDLYKDGTKQTRCNFCDCPVTTTIINDWKYYGNKLLLSDDRIKYLERFLEK